MRLEISDYVLFTVVAAHLIAAPYTKVEESFNIQAIHDLVIHGTDISSVCNKFIFAHSFLTVLSMTTWSFQASFLVLL